MHKAIPRRADYFPEVVMRLGATGTERYIANLTGRQKLSYGTDGSTHRSSLAFHGPGIAQNFSAAGITSAISQIREQKIDYQTFLRQIMQAGCSHYKVFIIVHKAIYFGRDGSQHIEHFPAK